MRTSKQAVPAGGTPVFSEAAYRAVIEHVSDGMMVVQDETIVFCNQRAAQLVGMSAEELLGANFVARVHPEDLPMVLERHRKGLAGEQVPRDIEFRVRWTDGQVRWLGVRVSAIPWNGRHAVLTFFSDVTEHRAVIESLRRSEERYHAVVEHVGEGMAVELDAQLVFANDRAADLLGATREQLSGGGFAKHVFASDLAGLADLVSRAAPHARDVSRHELRLARGDGSSWIELGVNRVPWGGREALLYFFSDISRRKNLEERLRVTLEERETVLTHAVVGIALLDADGHFRWANPAMERIFGGSSEGVRTMERFYLSREHYLRIGGEVAQCIREGRAYEEELQMRRFSGEVFWAALSGRAINARDSAQGTVWTVMDISRRKALEEALKRSSSEREAIFNSALVGVCFNIRRRIQYANDKYLEMTGYARHELEGQSSRVFYASDEAFEEDGERTSEALRRDGTYIVERQLLRRNGEAFWARLAGRCLNDRDPQSGVIWTVLDITERKRAEDDIRAALEQQKELNQLRSRFVAMTSHEFRTPLATILSSAELLRHYSERMPQSERDELLGSIESGVHRMTQMLDRILLIGQSEAQMLEFHPRALDLARLCEEIVAQTRLQWPDTRVEISLECAGTPPGATYDETLLRHILSNLLSNAVKYSPAGGKVSLSVRAQDGRTVIEVRDQGIGIPPDEIGHLFESFHRASNVGDIKGTGLGLAIVRKAVERHGGVIEVASTLGQGTCFTVRI